MGKIDSLYYHGYEYDESFNESLRMQWHLTAKCDQKCKHCYMLSDKMYKPQINSQMSTEQSFKLIDDFYLLVKKIGVTGSIFLTGGDPILSHNFWEILEYVQGKYSKMIQIGCIMGNSYHIDNKSAVRLVNLGIRNYQISLDGLELSHDKMRKTGSFKDALRALKLLHEVGINTVVMATVHKDNVNEIIDLYKFLTTLEYVDAFAFDKLIPIGNGKALANDGSVSNIELRDMLLKIFKYEVTVSERRILVYKDCLRLWKPLFYELGLSNPFNKESKRYYGTCFAGSGSFSVLADGTMLACRRLDIIAGKYPEETLEEIYLHSKLFKALRASSDRSGCNCVLQYHCNGCNALKYSTNGIIDGRDPSCWFDEKKHSFGNS